MDLQRDSRLVRDLDSAALMRPDLLNFDWHEILRRLAIAYSASHLVNATAKHSLLMLCVLRLGTVGLFDLHKGLIVDAVGDGGPVMCVQIYVRLLPLAETVRQL